jgi:hypothetical protein
MGVSRFAPVLVAASVVASSAPAHAGHQTASTLVSVNVQVDGREAPLYPSPDGSGRYYLEARTGSRYAVSLTNRTAERLGVVLTVDGLNAISGARDVGRGRMYVLDPWQGTTVQGWRTSLSEVRQFTFVDERRSYAARTGQANGKLGWIELAVYRERRAFVTPRPVPYFDPSYPPAGDGGEGRAQAPAGPLSGAERDAADTPRSTGGAASRSEGEMKSERRSDEARSYPGTGWGERAHDPVVLVSFDAEARPAECVTLRYEYRAALVALGVLPPAVARDRLWQREQASQTGFAQPPRW